MISKVIALIVFPTNIGLVVVVVLSEISVGQQQMIAKKKKKMSNKQNFEFILLNV